MLRRRPGRQDAVGVRLGQEQLLDCRHDDYFHTAPATRPRDELEHRALELLDTSVAQDPLTVSVQASTSTAETGDLVTLTASSAEGVLLRVEHHGVGLHPGRRDVRDRDGALPLDRDRPGDRAGPGRGRLRAGGRGDRPADGPGRRADRHRDRAGRRHRGRLGLLGATVSGKPTLGYRWSASGACTLSSTTSPAPVATCPVGSAGTGTTFGLTLTQGDGQQVVAEPVTVAVVAAPSEPQEQVRPPSSGASRP